MAETLSPNPTTSQRNGSMAASVLQSPTSPFFLGSNDDNLERVQARAARAAAIRRKSLAACAAAAGLPRHADPCLDKQQIFELFQNCIKLASENKINQKNTWELKLIDHLDDIIKAEEEEDAETNFQKASCTLEAGVKIYSLRVDSVHSEAYKVLGGINRAGHDDYQDNIADATDDQIGQEGHSKKESEKKMSPTSTLESSFEALNVKKFDVAFAVDPLYHQTTAQFDEGGAKGLLLNNLGVYGGCRVLFDSSEIPGKCISSTAQQDSNDMIELTFAKEYVEQMVMNMRVKEEISPTLRTIIDQFDDDNRRQEAKPYDYNRKQSEPFSPPDQIPEPDEAAYQDAAVFDGNVYDDETWNLENGDQTSVIDDGPSTMDAVGPLYHEGNEGFSVNDADADDRFEKVDGYLFLSLGFNSKQNAWAGPDHWKYRKAKEQEDSTGAENESQTMNKRSRRKKKVEIDIDFTAALNSDLSDNFAPPKNPKSLLLPANRAASNTKLPEDCHYQPEDLVKLFLLPNILCLGKKSRNPSAGSTEQHDGFGPPPSWEDENVFDGPFDDGLRSEDEGSTTLVSQPRQVNKIEVQYDKTSKQVDVQALKEVLWEHVKESPPIPSQEQAAGVSFREVLSSFPSKCNAAASLEDISPHLCFICLLHLANEHGLSICGSPSLDDLRVHLPPNSGTLG